MVFFLRDKKKYMEAEALKRFWGTGKTQNEFDEYCRKINGALINEDFCLHHKVRNNEELPYIFETEYDKRICYDGWLGTVFDKYEGFENTDDVFNCIEQDPERYVIVDDMESNEVPWLAFKFAMDTAHIVDTASAVLNAIPIAKTQTNYQQAI